MMRALLWQQTLIPLNDSFETALMTDTPNPSVERISMKMIAEEVFAFFSFERGALHTTHRLLLSPGTTIRNYIHGEDSARRRLTNPLRYLAMSTAVVTVAYVFLMPRDLFVQDVQSGFEAGQGMVAERAENGEEAAAVDLKAQQVRKLLEEIDQESTEIDMRLNAREAKAALEDSVSSRVAEITMAWMNVFLLAALPVNSLLTWLVFRKARFNLAEHLATNAFVLGFQNLLAVVMLVPTVLWSTEISTGIYMLLSVTYQFIAWKSVFDLKGFLRLLACIFVVILSAIAYLTFQGIATITLFWIATRSI